VARESVFWISLLLIMACALALVATHRSETNLDGAASSTGGTGGAVYYVTASGSNSNPGTITQPFLTIQKAVDVAVAGDTIIVRDGVYGPTASCSGGSGYAVNINKAGTSSAWITLKAEHKRGTTLDAQNACHSYINLGGSAAYWIIQDFRVINGYIGGIWSNSGADFITVKGNEIAYIGQHYLDSIIGICGSYANSASNDLVFDGNVFHDIGRTGGPQLFHDHALYLHSQNSVIINNVFYRPIEGWPIQTAVDFSGLIAGNTFHGAHPTREGQIMLWDPNGAVTIRNNIFYAPRQQAITSYTFSSTACVVDNNIVYGSGVSLGAPSSCSGSGNHLNIDPLFVNAVTMPYDVHLRSGSPAIDAGVAVLQDDTDMDGDPRPQGSAYDLGADEYALAGTDTAAPVASITSPADGATVSDTVSMTAFASDNVAVAKVEFSVDGVLQATDASSPYGFSWDTTRVSDGIHSLTAKAYDTTDNTNQQTVTVVVQNTRSCPVSGTAWKSQQFDVQTGAFRVEFDAVPNAANIDGVIGFSQNPSTAYTDNAALVLFNITGGIQAFDGILNGYAAQSSIPYSAGAIYHFRLEFSLPNRTYSAYVKQASGLEIVIAANRAYRQQATSFAYLNIVSSGAGSGGTLSLCNVTVTSGDVTPPTIPTNLSATAVSSSQIRISWSASTDDVAVAGYKVYRCQGAACVPNEQIATTPVASYTDGGLSSATYRYAVVAFDTAGNPSSMSAASAATPVAPDMTPPSIAIAAPTNRSTVSGAIHIVADARDDIGVVGVQFKVDGANYGAEDTIAPYSASLNTTTLANTNHDLGAVARDAAGNKNASTSTVSVSNVPATTLAINHVSAVTDAHSALVRWTTNIPSTTQVEYGKTMAYGWSTPVAVTMTTDHQAIINALSRRTTYHYRVKSTYGTGSTVISKDKTFRTASTKTNTIGSATDDGNGEAIDNFSSFFIMEVVGIAGVVGLALYSLRKEH
jgi:hypothetical protein